MEKVFKPVVIELTKKQIAKSISAYIDSIAITVNVNVNVEHFNELFNTKFIEIPSEEDIESVLTDEDCQKYIDFVYDNKIPEWLDDDAVYEELYYIEREFYKELGIFQKLV